MDHPRISVIIPVYNEDRTIGSVVEIARTWRADAEVIVVNDGSTDFTLPALKRFPDGVRLISYRKNRGKGYAMARGIEKALGEFLVFLDGDLVGLTHQDLTTLATPVLAGQADMCWGSVCLWTHQPPAGKVFDALTGERTLLTKNVLPLLSEMKKVGYGVELLLNNAHKRKKVVRVELPHVYLVGKLDKQTVPLAMQSYAKEARELITQAAKQYSNDLSPQAKKIFRGIQTYLKHMLESR